MIYLIDTDHATFVQGGTAEGEAVRRRLRDIAPDDYGTTIVTYEEQCRGWLDNINRAQTPATRIMAYTELKDHLLFFSRIAVWDYDAAADAVFVTLTQAKVRVGTKDLRIASIALANNATLLTRNTKDFVRVPNLRFEDWSI